MSTGIMHSPTVRRIVGPTILLASGNYFDFLAPEASTFTIDDIAHGLSHVCRFAGHCQRFYSVAQHSVIASKHVPGPDAYAALMHDAAEAFVGDMAKPLKDLCPEYREIEKRVEAAVFQRFAVPLPLPPSVKEIDTVMLATEQRELMRNRDDWNYTRGRQPLDISIPPMTPAEAKAAFLARFAELAPAGIARPLYEAAPRPAGEPPAGQGEPVKEDGCILCCNGAELPPGEYCRACGRVSKKDSLLAALNKLEGPMAPPTTKVAFASSEAAPRPAPTEEEIARTIAEGVGYPYDPSQTDFSEMGDPGPEDWLGGARTVLALFRDADRGAGEGER